MSEQEEFEFRARMEAESAATTVKGIKELPKTSIAQDIGQGVGNLAAGALRGAGSIGATLMWPIDKATDAIKGDRGPNIRSLVSGQQKESRNEQRRRQMDEGLREAGADTDSFLYGAGKLTGEIAGTAGAGGVIGQGVARGAPLLTRAGMSAPAVANTVSALSTGGFRAGTATGKTALGLRAGAGGVTGGVSAAMVDPRNGATGAGVGAILPSALQGAGKLAGYAGRSIGSVVRPFTNKGQDAIRDSILRKFAEDGPTAINAAEIVPGSLPTLAEATGNAGLATLQRAVRDVAPNSFVARETANASARNAAFDDLAGDAGKLDFFRANRSQTGNELYEAALRADTRANFTPYVKGQITQLLKRPSINDARKTAQQWAIERGERPSFDGNMRSLHDMKMALDDEISVATRAGKGGQVKALEATQTKLLDVMEKLSPAYKEARVTYATMSKPVNAMESLQRLKLTDAQGNITLSKVKNAIESLERSRNSVGVNPAKSIEETQMKALKAIQADLLRQSNTGLGRSAGSNTFQNIATDNIISTILPGRLGDAVKGKAGGLAGQAGRLLYSGPNEAIRGKLADAALDPALARNAFSTQPPQISEAARLLNEILNRSGPGVYRAAPLLSFDQ